MVFEVEVLNSISQIDKNQWNSLAEQSKLGNLFHRYEWLKAVEEGIGLEAKHIVVKKSNNPVGIFPNFISKIKGTPFKIMTSAGPSYGGPITATKKERKILDLIFERTLKILGFTVIWHRIRTHSPENVRYEHYFEKMGYKSNLEFCDFIINLDNDEGYIKSKMRKFRRRNLTRILEKDYSIREEKIDEGNLGEFYKSYLKVIEKVQGNQLPFSFFISMMNNLANRMKIFSAYIDDVNIGKTLLLLDKEKQCIYSFLSGIEKTRFEYYPYELTHWHSIKWGLKNGYKKYVFGSTSSDFTSGRFKFKEEFGGEIIPILSWEKNNILSNLGFFLMKKFHIRYNLFANSK
ncbi:hypothetical protein [[Eubacterium] cellulosolvens]